MEITDKYLKIKESMCYELFAFLTINWGEVGGESIQHGYT
jgi:hypothetical protein